MGFRSCVRHFRDAILGASPPFTATVFSHPGTSSSSKSLCSSRRKRQPKFIAAARGKSNQNHHFLWVSEVTLGASPSFTAMVFSHPDQQQQKPLQQQEEKVAKIHSSSKMKKQPKSSFSMGFRSYVRGFSVLHCHGVFLSGDQQQQQQKPLQQQEEKVAKIHSSSKRKKQPKSSFSLGFRSYVRGFSVLHCHGVFPSGPAAAKAFAAAGGKGSQNS